MLGCFEVVIWTLKYFYCRIKTCFIVNAVTLMLDASGCVYLFYLFFHFSMDVILKSMCLPDNKK